MSHNLAIGHSTFKLREIIIALFAGIVLGLLIHIYTGYTRWIVSLAIALIILSMGIAVKNPKHFFLSLFFLSLPIVTRNYIGRLSQFHYGGSSGFYNTFYDFPLLMLYLFWIPQVFITKIAKIHFSKLDFCMLSLIGMSFLSMYNATDKQLCLYAISRLIVMYFIFFYMANAITSKRDLKFIIVPILIGLFLESLLGIFQYCRGQAFGLGLIGEMQELVTFRTISRVGGTFGHPNAFARYLGFLVPLAISLQFAPIKRRYKIFCGLTALTAISALIITLSRAAWGGFIISMFILLFLGFKARLFSLRKAVSIVVVGVILLTIVIFVFRGVIFTRLFSDDYGAAWSRMPLMKVALNIIKTHPFLGMGINNYAEVMQRYDNTIEGISFKMPYDTVHNSYLLIASEIGIMGLLLFLWFIIQLYKRAVKIMNCNDRFIICITIGIMAGFISFLTQLLVMPPNMISPSFLFFWTISSVIVAISYLNQRRVL